MKTKIKLCLSFLFVYGILAAQPVTNLSIINKLVNQSIDKIGSSFTNGDKNISLNFVSVPSMRILKGNIVENFIKRGFTIENDNTSRAEYSVDYTIENISVVYDEVRKDGLFGDVLVNRKIELSGNYSISNRSEIIKSDKFYYSETDTLGYDALSQVENPELPFTEGEIPPEPLFSNLVEPLIVAGALIVTVILFFTVRSK